MTMKIKREKGNAEKGGDVDEGKKVMEIKKERIKLQ